VRHEHRLRHKRFNGLGKLGPRAHVFQTVKMQDGTEPNKDLRTFEGMKNNYGERGGKFDLVFEKGLFRRVTGPTSFEKMARQQKLNETFLNLLKSKKPSCPMPTSRPQSMRTLI
jgi:hypothetical protein